MNTEYISHIRGMTMMNFDGFIRIKEGQLPLIFDNNVLKAGMVGKLPDGTLARITDDGNKLWKDDTKRQEWYYVVEKVFGGPISYNGMIDRFENKTFAGRYTTPEEEKYFAENQNNRIDYPTAKDFEDVVKSIGKEKEKPVAGEDGVDITHSENYKQFVGGEKLDDHNPADNPHN